MKLFRSIMAMIMLASTLFISTIPATVLAAGASSDQACQAILAVNPSGSCDTKEKASSSLTKVIRTILQLLTLVAGVIAVIMFIVGGFKYITSQGDANSAASARNTLIYAIAGLVVVLFAQMIVKFVLSKAA